MCIFCTYNPLFFVVLSAHITFAFFCLYAPPLPLGLQSDQPHMHREAYASDTPGARSGQHGPRQDGPCWSAKGPVTAPEVCAGTLLQLPEDMYEAGTEPRVEPVMLVSLYPRGISIGFVRRDGEVSECLFFTFCERRPGPSFGS